MWIPGYEERYNAPPVTGAVVFAVVGREVATANTQTNTGLARNADGYVKDNLPAMAKPQMRKVPVSPPLPPALLEAIRQAKKARGEKAED